MCTEQNHFLHVSLQPPHLVSASCCLWLLLGSSRLKLIKVLSIATFWCGTSLGLHAGSSVLYKQSPLACGALSMAETLSGIYPNINCNCFSTIKKSLPPGSFNREVKSQSSIKMKAVPGIHC